MLMIEFSAYISCAMHSRLIVSRQVTSSPGELVAPAHQNVLSRTSVFEVISHTGLRLSFVTSGGCLVFGTALVLMEARRHMLSVMPPDIFSVTTTDTIPDFSLLRTSSSDAESSSAVARKRRKTKGWDGEAHALFAPPPPPVDASHTLQRTLETRANPDGGATTHAVIRCSLAEIARATNLRVEDAAFAMNECGLFSCHDEEQTIVVTREVIEKIASEKGLKRMCMEAQHVLLP
jgi:hypothetical protein